MSKCEKKEMVCAYFFILICCISYLSYFFLWYNQEMNWGLWINVLNGYALEIKKSNQL